MFILFASLHHRRHITWRILVSVLLLQWIIIMSSAVDVTTDDDILSPYVQHHGPVNRKHRDTQACQSIRFGNVTHSKFPITSDQLVLPLIEPHHMIRELSGNFWNKREVYISHQIINNPLTTWSVLEPNHPGTCQNGSAERAIVADSAKQKQCLVATNAGFFNTHTGECLGNIVSEGLLIQDSDGVQNAHFGITKDGYIYTGYLSELDLLIQDFIQLVGGVVWLVRDGQSYVSESRSIECPDAEETGTVERFINVVSARTAVGHDAEGRIHMVQVNGKTDITGINLYEFADLLIELGLVNAINLDGGGSATLVINGTLANFPSDKCVNSSYNCARKVSTILCVHEPDCIPEDCSGHGSCVLGVCQCQGQWVGPACDRLECQDNCNGHGDCTEEGCQCHAGWKGENCSASCQEGWFGMGCSLSCVCENNGVCNPESGACHCLPGFTGRYCQKVCPSGHYGQDCSEICLCTDSCYCDPITGNCTASVPDDDIFKVSKCLAKQQIRKHHLVPDKREQYSLCITSAICVSIIATLSLLLNVILTYLLLKARQGLQRELKHQTGLAVKYTMQTLALQRNNSENDDEDEDEDEISRMRNRKTNNGRLLKKSRKKFVDKHGRENYEMERREKLGEEDILSSAQEEDSLLLPAQR